MALLPAGRPRMNPWDELLPLIERKVGSHSFATWFRPTRYVAQQGPRITVRVPNAEFKDWLAKNYQGAIDEALQELGKQELHVVFQCDAVPAPLSPAAAERESLAASALNPKYTFESFVVGASNQFAHAAARAVAEIPS